MSMAAQLPTTPPTLDFHPTYPSSRKRRAATPPSPLTSPFVPQPSSPWVSNTYSQSSAPDENAGSRGKRRRPNLANGFEGLSLTPRPASQVPLGTEQDDEDEEGDRPYTQPDDIQVQILPDRPTKRSHHHSSTHHWSIPNQASSSSSASSITSDDADDTDTTFVHPFRQFARAQQADEVVQPESVSPTNDELGVEDVTYQYRRTRKRRDLPRDAETAKRARMEEMDVDMDGFSNSGEASRDSEDKQRKRKTVWHEPEKDRVIITSLSDTSSASSRSSSPDSEYRSLSQPGAQGFTLSPSLLTHIINAQRDQLKARPGVPKDQSLVLYRPLGIAPGAIDELPRSSMEIPGRFEEVNDEDVLDVGMEAAYGQDDEDMAMDVE